MKKTQLVTSMLASMLFAGISSAGVIAVTPNAATAPAGGGATTPAVIGLSYTPAAGDATVGLQASVQFDSTKATVVVAGANGGSCSSPSAGVIRVIVADAANMPLATIASMCNMTFTTLAAATAPVPLTVNLSNAGKGCFNALGDPTTCTATNGTITPGGGGGATAPTQTYTPATNAAATTVTFPGGAAGAAAASITIASAGAAGTGNSVLSGCAVTPAAFGTATTVPANGTFNTATTSGSIALTCTRAAAAQTASLSCTETATPTVAGSPFTRTWGLTCPAAGVAAVAPTLGALAATTLATGVSPAATGSVAVPVATAGTAVANVAIACTIPAGANAFAVTSGTPQTFTAPATVPGTATVGLSCNRTAAIATATLSCTQTATPAGAALPALTSVVTCPALAVVATAVSPTSPPPGQQPNLPAQPFGGGTSSQLLTFGATGAATMNCAITPASAGYSVAPAVVNLTAAGPNTATVTFTGTASGTFSGTAVCTPVAPATGGPFSYSFATVVAGAPPAAPQVQVPALGNISLMLLIAGFLGLGVVLVNRRQA